MKQREQFNKYYLAALGLHFVGTIGVVFWTHLVIPIIFINIIDTIICLVLVCLRQKKVDIANHLILRMTALCCVSMLIFVLGIFAVIMKVNALASLLSSRFAVATRDGALDGVLIDPAVLLLCYAVVRGCTMLKRKTA